MSDIKLAQRVRVLRSPYQSVRPGDIGIVVAEKAFGVLEVLFPDSTWHFYPHELEEAKCNCQ